MTDVGYQYRVDLVGLAGSNLDAFGLLRTTGKPGERYNIEFIFDKQPLLVDEVLSGNGESTFNANSRDIMLSVSGDTPSDAAALYGYDVPYTPGSSQLFEMTGTINNAGIEGGVAQLFLRSKVGGTVLEEVYDQSDWHYQPSSLNWRKSQIFAVDLQSLRVGRIRYALNRGGEIVPLHEITNDNIRNTGYWQTASLPPSWRIYNDETYTYAEMAYGDAENAVGLRYRMPLNAAATMRAICCTVKSEGGVSLLEIPGLPATADNGVTPVEVSSTLIPVLSIRVSALFNGLVNRGLYIPEGLSVEGDNPIRFVVLYRAALTGANWQAVDTVYSGMEYDVSATAVSGGIAVYSDYLSTGRNSVTKATGVLGRSLMRLGRTGVADTLTIAAVRTSGTDSDTMAAIQWKEIR